MQKIALIYMGGTFGCVGEPLAPMPQHSFLPKLQTLLPKQFDVQCFSATTIKDSSACTAVDWLQLIQQIQQLQQTFKHFIIIHGTDTLSYAAATLSRFLAQSCHVILTGSQFPLLDPTGEQLRPISDAMDNLNTALKHILHVEAGVYLAFDQQLYHAATALKLHTTALKAFHGLAYHEKLNQRPKAAFEVHTTHLQRAQQLNILNWMLQPVEKATLAKNLKQLSQTPPDFLILQGYGTGNMASDTEIIQALQLLKQKGCVCILTTQVALGETDQRYAITQWTQNAAILINDCYGHADLYAKILKIYLEYRTTDQYVQHWSDHLN